MDKARALAERADIFSSNETGEEIATRDLKYLLIPYYLAELLLEAHGLLSSRKDAVEKAMM